MLIFKDTYLNSYRPEPSPYDSPREWSDEEWNDMMARQADELDAEEWAEMFEDLAEDAEREEKNDDRT